MDQDLHQNQNNQKPQTIGGVTFSAGLSHPVTPQVSPGSNQPSFAKPASEQSNITTPQPTIPSPADLFNNNSAAFSAPQSTSATTQVSENPANAYQPNSYTSPAASAEQIFTFIHDKLLENQADWTDLTEITFFAGPGSFTGLRIGAAVVNALADQLQIPLKNQDGEVVPIILPNYGRPANSTPSKK